MAIDNQNYSYRFINQILKNKMTEMHEEQLQTQKPLPKHTNIRGKTYFSKKEEQTGNQQTINF